MLYFDMANYRRIFLDGYSYYITMVTYDRNPILVENITLLRESFRYAKSLFDFDITDIVILPDHLHMIIEVSHTHDYPKIISSIKRYFSKHCEQKYYQYIKQSKHRQEAGYYPIWQKRYYEHTIRDEKDYREKAIYLYNNPVKHGYVKDIAQWEHRSRRCDHVARSSR